MFLPLLLKLSDQMPGTATLMRIKRSQFACARQSVEDLQMEARQEEGYAEDDGRASAAQGADERAAAVSYGMLKPGERHLSVVCRNCSIVLGFPDVPRD